ncbi:MAG: tRNA (N6-threonylcarbamoyladenosine(37)-N6)-methyltransferase TrmO [Deltaproteobacteria bacterium]|nr:tRNA (N6-threonylcarbamoyladenosine(37)-N6)-methyltransferase TrmO [Deltaproteobacteria bacterium]
MTNKPMLVLEPIGIARTGLNLKFEAPLQASEEAGRGSIELFSGKGFENALSDLSGFDRIWLIWWFHKNREWRPMVRPPRGKSKRRGVFATRSPHRPNPLGLSAVRLLGISGLTLEISGSDLLDGTPIFDIKPYIEGADSFHDCRQGWLEEVEQEESRPPLYAVQFERLARQQLDWLGERGINIAQKATAILERNPEPHRSRRIKRLKNGLFQIGCGAWRMFYRIKDKCVIVGEIRCGYPIGALTNHMLECVPHRSEQLQFYAVWGIDEEEGSASSGSVGEGRR